MPSMRPRQRSRAISRRDEASPLIWYSDVCCGVAPVLTGTGKAPLWVVAYRSLVT
jgi:hypothetical protein